MRTYAVQINGAQHQVTVLEKRGTFLSFSVEGTRYDVDVAPLFGAIATGASGSTTTGTGSGQVKAEMPGVVVSVSTTIGAEVKAGDTVMVVEAMKMENNISAPIDGTVEAIHVKAGDELDNDQLLLEITPA